MSTIRFTAEIGQDQTIHPPVGVQLAQGMAEVIVVQPSNAKRSQTDDASPRGVPEIAKHLARFAHSQGIEALPSDFALNHDHYLHGAPKGIDLP